MSENVNLTFSGRFFEFLNFEQKSFLSDNVFNIVALNLVLEKEKIIKRIPKKKRCSK